MNARMSMFLVMLAATGAYAQQPAQIGSYRQLFVDDAMVAGISNVTYTLHQPTKHAVGGVPTPVVMADQPWEQLLFIYGTTIYDQQSRMYKMWYESMPDSTTTDICYATSTDGVNWTKPNLGVTAYGGSTANNIVGGFDFYTDGFGVIKDVSDPNPARRYKMLTYKGGDTFAAMVSPDGINWSGPINTGASATYQTGDVLSTYYDTGLKKYVGLTKRYINGVRSRTITYSDDFVTWTAPTTLLTPDAQDPATAQLYSQVGYMYEGMRIGYVSVYDTATQKIDTQLVSSRDGLSWQRYRQRTPFILNGAAGQFDSGMAIADCAGLVTTDNKILIYYSGSNFDHNGNVIGGGVSRSDIGMAELRKDGFVSADAGAAGGTPTTTPFVLPTGRLTINATTAPGGSIRAELLDANGLVLAGYEAGNSSVFAGDSLNALQEWSGRDIDESLLGTPVALRFYITDGSLYSFGFTVVPGAFCDHAPSVGRRQSVRGFWRIERPTGSGATLREPRLTCIGRTVNMEGGNDSPRPPTSHLPLPPPVSGLKRPCRTRTPYQEPPCCLPLCLPSAYAHRMAGCNRGGGRRASAGSTSLGSRSTEDGGCRSAPAQSQPAFQSGLQGDRPQRNPERLAMGPSQHGRHVLGGPQHRALRSAPDRDHQRHGLWPPRFWNALAQSAGQVDSRQALHDERVGEVGLARNREPGRRQRLAVSRPGPSHRRPMAAHLEDLHAPPKRLRLRPPHQHRKPDPRRVD